MGSKKYTPDKVMAALNEKRPELIVLNDSPEIGKKISVRSTECGHTWDALCDNLLYHHSGCPVCYHKLESMESYKQRLLAARPRIEVLHEEETVNYSMKIRFRCLDCGLEFDAYPCSFFVRTSGHGCPRCGHKTGGRKLRLTQSEFENRVSETSPEVEVVGKYINRKTKVGCECKACGYRWDAIPGDIISNGVGCPRCKMSHGEKRIATWLDAHDIDYTLQYKFKDCVDKECLPFDFYLPKYNACIEFDGEQHFKPIKYFGGISHLRRTIMHDKIKDDYCDKNNVLLWRIPYNDEDNIDKELQIYIAYCHLCRFVFDGQATIQTGTLSV